MKQISSGPISLSQLFFLLPEIGIGSKNCISVGLYQTDYVSMLGRIGFEIKFLRLMLVIRKKAHLANLLFLEHNLQSTTFNIPNHLKHSQPCIKQLPHPVQNTNTSTLPSLSLSFSFFSIVHHLILHASDVKPHKPDQTTSHSSPPTKLNLSVKARSCSERTMAAALRLLLEGFFLRH